jgi:DNA polymerase-3 subunit delta
VPALKPAYLIHGDDHGRVAERRANLRALAEREGGAQGVELLEGDAATAGAVIVALSALTFALGRRVIVVDGVERWRDADAARLRPALANLAEETTVAFFGREEGRLKVPAALAEAVRAAGGDVRAETAAKPWELPKWVQARARELDLDVSTGAAKALIEHVGDRQQRLARELEKLALAWGPGARIEPEQVEALTAVSAERRAWTLADALVAGDRRAAARAYLELREQGERLPGLLYVIVQRLRLAHEVARRLEAGEAPADVRKSLRMPSRAADRLIADIRGSDLDVLRRGIELMADLELSSRGGGAGVLSEDTRAVQAFLELAS